MHPVGPPNPVMSGAQRPRCSADSDPIRLNPQSVAYRRRLRSRRMDALARFAQPWLDRAARIGADPRDDEDLRFRKALLVLVCVLVLPISLVWGAIYLAFGVTAGLIAWLYFLVSAAAIAIFSRTRDTEWFLRVELTRHPARPDDLDGVRRRLPAVRCRRPVGHPGPARRARVQRRALRACAGSSPSWRCSSSPGSWARSPAASRPCRAGSRAR